MKKHHVYTLFAALLLISAGSCKKDSQPETREEQMRSGPWVFQSASASGSDVSGFIPACNKDNYISFNTGGIGSIDEKTDVCSPSNAVNFLWSLTNGETKLSMSATIIPGGSGEFNIVSLNSSTLVLSQETSLIPSPTPVTVVVTLVHP